MMRTMMTAALLCAAALLFSACGEQKSETQKQVESTGSKIEKKVNPLAKKAVRKVESAADKAQKELSKHLD
ncbi:MAG: hypothetical protein J6W81_01705 [Lentisphaeria bacterium]|nr:hypothetical protein [Lentisphaeria bacterium]